MGWVARNISNGVLTDVTAGLRLSPGAAPDVALSYAFRDATARVAAQLPADPRRPGLGEVALRTDSSITAALSLLDLPPFRFMEKAGREVDIASGRARLSVDVEVPLQQGAPPGSVVFSAEGTLEDVQSETLVPGRVLAADTLDLSVWGRRRRPRRDRDRRRRHAVGRALRRHVGTGIRPRRGGQPGVRQAGTVAPVLGGVFARAAGGDAFGRGRGQVRHRAAT